MCIRDRYKGSPNAPGSFVRSRTAIFLAVLGITSNNAEDTQGPVSYTHLDVYKRQALPRIVLISPL